MHKIELDNNKLEKYNNIKTPEELYEFMESYIKYGIEIDGKVYEWGKDDFQKACEEKWRLKSSLDIIKSGYGHCWDQTEIERDWFKKHNYEYKTLFIIFLIENNNPYVCHTYLIYKDKKDNKWCWFEHADYNNKGIHKFNTMEEAILAQKEKHIEFNKSLNLPMTKDIIDTIHIYEYQSPKIGSTNQEFLDNIFNNAKDITKKLIKKS